MNTCSHCGKYTETHLHHIFYGTGKRKVSIKYESICSVKLCFQCHRMLHDGKLKEYDLHLKQSAQRKWEEIYDPDGDHEKFIKEFGRSYL